MRFLPGILDHTEGEGLFIPGLLQQGPSGGMGQVVLIRWIGGSGVGYSEEVPNPIRPADKAMIIDIPWFLFADTGIVNLNELACVHNGFILVRLAPRSDNFGLCIRADLQIERSKDSKNQPTSCNRLHDILLSAIQIYQANEVYLRMSGKNSGFNIINQRLFYDPFEDCEKRISYPQYNVADCPAMIRVLYQLTEQ
jgi:hypothetical protein